MTLKCAYQQGIERLRSARVPEPELDAWYLLEYVTGIGHAAYYADPEKEVPEEQMEQYDRYLAIREGRVPLQHITGRQEFMGLEFLVNGDVLIPRQDTETLVEGALKLLKGGSVPKTGGRLRVLDLCTGSGCILLSVLRYAEQDMDGEGSDFSGSALQTARENAVRLGIEARFTESDLFENLKERYSMILSNPPYIESGAIGKLQEEVRLHDPLSALDGGPDGLTFYRKITDESREHLEQGGYLMFEIGCSQAEAVTDMMRRAGFCGITVKRDLAGLDRVVYGRYIRQEEK